MKLLTLTKITSSIDKSIKCNKINNRSTTINLRLYKCPLIFNSQKSNIKCILDTHLRYVTIMGIDFYGT